MLLMSNLMLFKTILTFTIFIFILMIFSFVAVEYHWKKYIVPWDKILTFCWVLFSITLFFSILYTIWFIL